MSETPQPIGYPRPDKWPAGDGQERVATDLGEADDRIRALRAALQAERERAKTEISELFLEKVAAEKKAEELEERVRKQKEKIVRLGTAWDRLHREALERIEEHAKTTPTTISSAHGYLDVIWREAQAALAPSQEGMSE